MENETWLDIGSSEELSRVPVRQVMVGSARVALSHRDGVFGAVSGVCNHAGGPLGRGSLDGDYVVCPWHQWKFHRVEGHGERGFEEDVVPAYEVRVRDGRVEVSRTAVTRRAKKPHEPHPLTRPVVRASGPVRVVGLSTTAMQREHPRFSASESLVEAALAHASARGLETRLIRLRDLEFRHCEGFYSKAARACTWPCSITQMDPDDQLDRSTRRSCTGATSSSSAHRSAGARRAASTSRWSERMNCIQNQITIAGKVLLQNKVVGPSSRAVKTTCRRWRGRC
jgi:nitrite reductase/ring-hydroxylating ferredoxin subunit